MMNGTDLSQNRRHPGAGRDPVLPMAAFPGFRHAPEWRKYVFM